MGEAYRKCTGIFIPIEILKDHRLSPNEKILFAEIEAMDKDKSEDGCYSGNKYLADLLGVSESQITRSIAKLKKLEYVEQVSYDGRKRVLNVLVRYLRVRKNAESDSETVRDSADMLTPHSADMPNLLHSIELKEKKEDIAQNLDNVKRKTENKNEAYIPLTLLLIEKLKLLGTEARINEEKAKRDWSNDFRLMVEQDNRTVEQIKAKMEAVYSPGEFWGTVIKSAGKLRLQWNAGQLDNVGKPKVSAYTEPVEAPEPERTPWQKLCDKTSDPVHSVQLMAGKIINRSFPGRWRNLNIEHGMKFYRELFEYMQEHEKDLDLAGKLVEMMGECGGY